ncbi:hypothetical protein REC12_19935 [Desulfosporosinus sp. PR]|uniref:hypothetical protein n=1 Tax=Candidatus Desulfosporosinus nitrosoreducens TaxID=3401928 RepID=UPI0027FCF9EB|nr:hypothetical protein [Desulfosporosinus sp. PR]MDQ7095868.1 hypothetical protein [Desulfosporosinus sp. PR]
MIFDVMKTILFFFPEGKKFNESNYKESKQFKRLIKSRDKYLKDHTLILELETKLKNVLLEYAIANWTSLQDSNCFEFKVLLHDNQPILDDDVQLMRLLGGTRTDLRIFISILAKYYYFFIEETHYDVTSQRWSFKTLNEFSIEIENSIARLQNLMNLEGYIELSTEIINTIVEGVETELIEQGNVKVFHCLFTDLVNP